MVISRQNATWQAQVSDDALLDITVRSRSRDEKIALWQKEHERLVVLFDGKVGYEWRDYMSVETTTIAPGAYVVIDPLVPPSMIAANIVGVTLDAPHYTLSYFYQARWRGEYWQKAKRFNKAQAEVTLEFLWGLYSAMNLAWYQEAPEIEKVYLLYMAFGDFIKKNVHGMKVHIPLILSPALLVSIQ